MTKRQSAKWKAITDAVEACRQELCADLHAAVEDAEEAETSRDRAEEEAADLRGKRDDAVEAAQGLLDAARAAALWMKTNGAVFRVGLPLYELETAIAEAERLIGQLVRGVTQ